MSKISFTYFKNMKSIIIYCKYSVPSIISANILSNLFKEHNLKHSVEYFDSIFSSEKIFEKNSLFVDLNVKIEGGIYFGGKYNNTGINSYCICIKEQPAFFILYYFLKEYSLFNRKNIWALISNFVYARDFFSITCDFCMNLRDELIFEAENFNIKYKEYFDAPFHSDKPLFDVLQNDIRFIVNYRLFKHTDISYRLYEILAKIGISIKMAREPYSILDYRYKEIIQDNLLNNNLFLYQRDYSFISAIEYFFCCAEQIKKSNFNFDCSTVCTDEGYAYLQSLMEIFLKNIRKFKAVGHTLFIILTEKIESFSYEILFQIFSYFVQNTRDGYEFILMVQRDEDLFMFSEKKNGMISRDEFRKFLEKRQEDY